jgi:putative FmdB family regulatory protein
MASYEYTCENGHTYIEVRSMNEDQKETKCPECGGDLTRKFTAPPIGFKGAGFAKPWA